MERVGSGQIKPLPFTLMYSFLTGMGKSIFLLLFQGNRKKKIKLFKTRFSYKMNLRSDSVGLLYLLGVTGVQGDESSASTIPRGICVSVSWGCCNRCHKPRGLKQRECILSLFQKAEVQSPGVLRATFPWRLWGESFLVP